MDSTRIHILHVAEKVFADKGLWRTSVHDLAKACDLGAASLYHYYPNKEAIFFAILEQNLKNLLEKCREQLAGITDPISRLEKYIWFNFNYAQSYPENSRLVLLELRHRYELAKIPAYHYMRELVNQLIPILRDGQEKGIFDRNLDSLTFRNIVWGTLEAFTRNWLIFKKPETIVEYAFPVTQAILNGVLFTGLRSVDVDTGLEGGRNPGRNNRKQIGRTDRTRGD